MISLPIKPIIVQHGNFLQLFAGERAGDRLAGEIPFASSFGIDQTQRRYSLLNEEFQPASINQPLEGAHGVLIVAEHNQDWNATYIIYYWTLLQQSVERIRHRCAIDGEANDQRARFDRRIQAL